MSFAFVGREPELSIVEAALEAVRTGRGRALLVAGEPGIGKTRLLEAAAELAVARGAAVWWARCTDAEGAPAFWPWVQMLRDEVGRLDGAGVQTLLGEAAAEVARLVPAIRDRLPDVPVPESVESPEARFRLFESVAAVLDRAARDQPLVVMVDDLQEADEPSLRLLEFVARTIASRALMVIAAYRERGPRMTQPLVRCLARLGREPATETVVLGGLQREAVAALAADALGHPAPDDLVSALHAETDGNPLFATAVLQAVTPDEVGADRPGAMPWLRSAPLREAVGRHLAPLSAATHDVLKAAAVLGREFGVDEVAPILGQPVEVVLRRLEEASDMRILVPAETAGRFRFGHAVIRDVFYGDLGASEQATFHGRAGEALSARADAEERLTEIAHHFVEAARGGGDAARAGRFARRAGDHALRVLAFEEASRLYGVALEQLGRSGGDLWARAELLLALGNAQNQAGATDPAKEAFLAAAETARALDARELLARAALGYAAELALPQGGFRDDVQVRLLEDALARWTGDDDPLHVRLLGRLASSLYFTDATERRVELCAEAVAMARRLGDRDAIADALFATHTATWGPDNPVERVAIATEVLRLAERGGDRVLAFRARVWLLCDHLEVGDGVGIDADFAALRQLAAELGQPVYPGFVDIFQAMRATLAGRFDDAERFARQWRALGHWLGRAAQTGFGVQLFMVRFLIGGGEELIEPTRAAGALNPAIPGFRCTIALLCARAGRIAEARAEIEHVAARDLAHIPRDIAFLAAACQLGEACALVHDRERCEMLYGLLRPYAGQASMIGTGFAFVGAVAHYLGILAAALGRAGEAAEHFRAALDFHDRIGASAWRALTQLEYGAALFRAGHVEAALGFLAAARDAGRALGMDGLVQRVAALGALPAGEAPPLPPADADRCVFRRDGSHWTIVYDGEVIRLRDAKGLRYLAQLLLHPGREFHVSDLIAGANAAKPAPAEAAEAGIERARVAVTKGLKRAQTWIEAAHPPLAQHLAATLQRGYFCAYRPDPRRPIVWTV
jgi:hypothetical protein